jgi:hypothetical protein
VDARPKRVCVATARPHRDPTHLLDSRGDDEVVCTGHHALRSEANCLLGRPALALDHGRGDVDGETCSEHSVSTDIPRLLAGLADAPDDYVLDLTGVNARARDNGGEHSGQELDGVC